MRSQPRDVASRGCRDRQSGRTVERDGGVALAAVQIQGLLYPLLGPPGVAPQLERQALDGEGETEAMVVALASEGRDTPVAEVFGLREISSHHRQRGQAAQPSGHTRGIVQLLFDGEALLEERPGRHMVVLAPGQATRSGQAAGTKTSIRGPGSQAEHAIDPRATFVDPSAERP